MKILTKIFKVLPNRIIINKKEYFLEKGYNSEDNYYYFKYCDNKGMVPVVSSETDYYALNVVENKKRNARKKLYKMLNNSKGNNETN